MKITECQNVYYYTWFFGVEDIPEKYWEAAEQMDKLFDGDHERFAVAVDYNKELDCIDGKAELFYVPIPIEDDEIVFDYEFTEEEINYMLDCIRKDLRK